MLDLTRKLDETRRAIAALSRLDRPIPDSLRDTEFLLATCIDLQKHANARGLLPLPYCAKHAYAAYVQEQTAVPARKMPAWDRMGFENHNLWIAVAEAAVDAYIATTGDLR